MHRGKAAKINCKNLQSKFLTFILLSTLFTLHFANKMSIAPIKVSPTEDGIRLHRWFGRHYPGINQGELRKLCRTGQIRVNSLRCKGNEFLRDGDQIRVPPNAANARREEGTRLRQGFGGQEGKRESGERFSLRDLEDLRRRIIHSDADIVVFNKPAGLATQGGTGIKKSLDKMAAALFPFDTVLLVHRLDRDTSGVIVLAKNQMAAQTLSAQFQDKTAQKEYLALLSGSLQKKSGVIDNFMVKGRVLDADDAEELKRDTGVRAHRAITKYKVLNELPGVVSWVWFMPMTGRTHQLRLHSAFSLCAPIVGDELYGAPEKDPGNISAVEQNLKSLINSNNLFLFAYRLTFRHPGTGKMMTIKAELPNFMRGPIKFLEFTVP